VKPVHGFLARRSHWLASPGPDQFDPVGGEQQLVQRREFHHHESNDLRSEPRRRLRLLSIDLPMNGSAALRCRAGCAGAQRGIGVPRSFLCGSFQWNKELCLKS